VRYGHVSGISKDAKPQKKDTFGYSSDEVLLLHADGKIFGFERKHDVVRRWYDCLRM